MGANGGGRGDQGFYEKFSPPMSGSDCSSEMMLAGAERDIQRLEREARGRNVRSDVAERKMQESSVAQRMSKVARPDESLTDIASKKARCILDALDGSFRGSVATFEATLGGRLLVNLAGGVVENAGISLDRCFGMPLIPGSAVKRHCEEPRSLGNPRGIRRGKASAPAVCDAALRLWSPRLAWGLRVGWWLSRSAVCRRQNRIAGFQGLRLFPPRLSNHGAQTGRGHGESALSELLFRQKSRCGG